MVTIKMKDETWETISRRDLELDVEYWHEIPYLVVRKKNSQHSVVRRTRL